VLGAAGRAALRRLAAGRVLLAFDFDGTLAAIAERPEQARMNGRMRRALLRVAQLYPCAVISGRARRELRRLLADVPVIALSGSHGAENPGQPRVRSPRNRVQAWASLLRRALRGHRGLTVERKPHGVAVHYRRAEDKEAAHAAILEVVAVLDGVRYIRGKEVLEVVPARSPNKGHALAALRRRLKPRATLYVGDDLTDEDAFASRGPGVFLTVRVTPTQPTVARFRLDGQEEVEKLLNALVRLARRANPGRGSGEREGRGDRALGPPTRT
jgi:trehalose-phosphatase